jgi:hypothetical protein
MVVGGDAVTREWDFNTRKIVAEHIRACDLLVAFEPSSRRQIPRYPIESTSDGADHK